jgi:Ca2+-binding RTX toxin-like protein
MADFPGTPNPDTWFGSSADETAHGGGGDDYLEARGGNDLVYGEGGNDILEGGPGVDLLDGGDGDDTLTIRFSQFTGSDLAAGDQFVGGAGVDRLVMAGDFAEFDLRGLSIGTDIEQIQSDTGFALVTFAQLQQFSRIGGIFRVTGSGTLDLSGGRFLAGYISLGTGNDIVTMAGNTPTGSALIGGGDGNDELIGSEGSDNLTGDGGNDRIEGRGGNDYLSGGDGDDLVLGGDGNDTFQAETGTDQLQGGAGDDIFMLDLGNGLDASDLVSGGSGADTLYISTPFMGEVVDLSTFGIADDFEALISNSAKIIASVERLSHFQRFEALTVRITTAGALVASDSFRVTNFELSDFGNSVDLSNAMMFAGSRVFGGAGADTIIGSDGADTLLSGGGGNDVIHGAAGGDLLWGGSGVDWLDGGEGNDTFSIVQGEQVSAGDRFTGGAGLDLLALGDPAAPVTVDLSGAIIDGDIESLEFSGTLRIGAAQLAGFSSIRSGTIELVGGGFVDLSNTDTRGYLVLGDAGNHVVLGPEGFFWVHAGAGNDTVDASRMIRPLFLDGFGGDDVLIGSGWDNEIYGREGNDRLRGGAGSDVLDGGPGTDEAEGGAGDDYYGVDSITDTVIEAVGGGNDWVRTLSSFTLAQGSEIERLTASQNLSTDPINLTGNEFANFIGGNDGDNLIDGGGGADEMWGEKGNDTYIVDSVGDKVVEFGADGNDTVRTSVSFALTVDQYVETLRTTNDAGIAAIDLGGNQIGNLIVGNAGANRLDGKGGDDRLEGGGGGDLLYSGEGLDQLFGGGGNDGLFFGAQFGAGDVANGGADTDTLALQGNYAGLFLGNVSNIELLLTVSGSDTRFGDTAGSSYDYGFVTNDALVVGGSIFTVISGDLRSGEDLTFDGSAETDGHFRIFAGRGLDRLTGGGGNDGFFFGADGNLTGADRIVGGAGTDTIALRGNYVGAAAVVFEDASFSGIQVVTFLSGHTDEFGGFINLNGFDYDLTLANGNIAAGQQLDVIATNLRANESARVDARAELDGTLRILTGAGDDILFGGAGNDTLSGGLGTDAIDGGSGNDNYVYRSAAESTAASRDTIAFTAGDKIDLALVDANGGTPANEAFSFIGDAAFSNVAGQLRAFQSGAQWIVEGDVNGDGTADLLIAVTSAAPLTVADFVL